MMTNPPSFNVSKKHKTPFLAADFFPKQDAALQIAQPGDCGPP
jgi:hypothetical protein